MYTDYTSGSLYDKNKHLQGSFAICVWKKAVMETCFVYDSNVQTAVSEVVCCAFVREKIVSLVVCDPEDTLCFIPSKLCV